MPPRIARFSLLFAFTLGALKAADAQALTLDPVLFGDLRLRFEHADQDDTDRKANGLTQSIRLGLETTLSSRFSALVEGEAVFAIVDDFNDGTGNNPDRPVILDPDLIVLNRAQITAKVADQAFITAGRQRLAIDDQRFIGTLAFRQNDQTFDAVHASWRTENGSTFQGGYIGRVNRALGPDNPNGVFRGNSYFLNANLQTPIGRIGVFHYALDLETGPSRLRDNTSSSRTTGARIEGRWHADKYGLDWEAAYARQTDFADNPLNYSADYWLASAQAFAGPIRAGFRAEILGAGSEQSFQTPLATLHRFQGEADVFLVTPPDGIVDLEASAVWGIGSYGPLKNISASAAYHWYNAERAGADYGQEFNIGVKAETIYNMSIGLIYANYDAETFATDTKRVFFSLSKRF